MELYKKILSIFIILNFNAVHSNEYQYILDDGCINELYFSAEKFFKNTDIKAFRDSRGIILRYEIKNILSEFYSPDVNNYKKLENFLAKIENPAIIEVHTGDFSSENLKNWEISTIIANNIEAIITKPYGSVDQNKINSVGYGEFLPAKNTSNNGGKYLNRVDIIVLCNISGE